jgi:TatD DNase family protein
MELFDTHCHVHEITKNLTPTHDKWFSDGVDRTADTVLQGAAEAGVARILVIGTTLEDSRLAIAFARQHSNVWASIGVHPHEAQLHDAVEVEQEFLKLAQDENVVAVGECGLDYFYEHSPKSEQITILKAQLSVARQANLPLIFHVREAYDDFWPIFDEVAGLRGVLHSFTDTQHHLQMALQRGLYIGVNGIATFSKDANQQEMYRAIPPEYLLLETDAPYLTPSPFRGKVCEPKHMMLTAEFIAGQKGLQIEQIARITTANARKIV